MTDSETASLLAVAVHASLADGSPDDAERARIRAAAEALGGDAALRLDAAFQSVLLEKRTLEDAVTGLESPEARRAAYDLAVTVCEADGLRSPAERSFLDRLRTLVGVDPAHAQLVEERTQAILTAPLAPLATHAPPATPDARALDQKILNYAILNGALELLPDSLATMAVIPLQMKLVYEVGQAHGYALDKGHITELLATVGVGAAGQAIQQVGRKLLGGLLGAIGGNLVGALGGQAAQSGLSFATTYALGQLARSYYGGGRKLDPAQLQASFQKLLGDAKTLATTYGSQIASRARGLDTASLAQLVTRGP